MSADKFQSSKMSISVQRVRVRGSQKRLEVGGLYSRRSGNRDAENYANEWQGALPKTLFTLQRLQPYILADNIAGH
jgi:hypothetical protein